MTKIRQILKVSNLLRELRKELGLSQQQLADEIKVTRATVNAIEKGDYNPSLELAFRLSNFFKITIHDIFYIDKEK